jgi:mannose-6-phosphate isomerase-like protein (cupin superfamily)
MSDYTVMNLEDVEDAAPKFGLAPDLEARFAREPLECRATGVSLQRFAPGFRFPFGHKHAQQEEIYVLVNGGGRMKVDDEIVELRRWDAIRVGSGTMRNFEAGPDGAELLAFGGPTGGGPNDAEMVPGWWAD